ncbi:MAG: hypothetical protein JXR73_04055 [Candidatus Omnitrophica bacterium]|nr:hypothetical protein [Candidatus Omnitrophota bacterium]
MKKQTWISILILAAFCLGFVKVQSMIINERAGRRVEEKILMLSNRPEITKILAMGHDDTLADILWIRAIQYFGGNFSSLNKPDKKPGMITLFRNMVALDPHFAAAYQFGGFVMNESIKDSDLAISFLLEGAESNPQSWRLRFDAGFIAFYQLKDYDTAKRLFTLCAYGDNYALNGRVETEGLVDGFSAKALKDDDLQGDVKLHPQNGVIIIDLQSPKTISRINVIQNTTARQSYDLAWAGDAPSPSEASFQTEAQSTPTGIYSFKSPVEARYIRLSNLKTNAEDGFFETTEVQLHGLRNDDVPTYVDRMAIEMDRAAGRYRAAWDQYVRYYQEAEQKGDKISASLAAEKLDGIYLTMVREILDEAIRRYLEQEGSLPSPQMRELVEGEYIQRVLQERVVEDDQFRTDLLPILLGENGNVYNILRTWDGRYPILMIPVPGIEEKPDWIITSRLFLEEEQKSKRDNLQKLVNQYKEEKGVLPKQLADLKSDGMFNAPDDIFEDPLGGEFFLNQENGQVEARNPKY